MCGISFLLGPSRQHIERVIDMRQLRHQLHGRGPNHMAEQHSTLCHSAAPPASHAPTNGHAVLIGSVLQVCGRLTPQPLMASSPAVGRRVALCWNGEVFGGPVYVCACVSSARVLEVASC
jgi:asparagine synthetase B (glutamine-hydrolysing)